MTKQTDIRGTKTGTLKRVLSEKRGHGDPYIRGDVRNKETFINYGEVSFTDSEEDLVFFTSIKNPKAVIATVSGAYSAVNQIGWHLDTKGRTPSGSYITINRQTDGATDAVSVVVLGTDEV